MILRRIFSVRPSAWLLVAVVAVVAVASIIIELLGLVARPIMLYMVQPLIALLVAWLTYGVIKGQKNRVRRADEKSLAIASVLAVWFVLYFLSGLAVTYVHNAVVSSVLGVFANVLAYGVVAISFEYARYGVMSIAGRRNIVWFGLIVAGVFAFQQMDFSGIVTAKTLQQAIELAVADIVPVLAQSLLLTYLAIAVGLKGQLVFRLGIVAMTFLPPILPKYDWYMLGVSALLLVSAIYIVIDRMQQKQDESTPMRRKKYTSRVAFDVMFVMVMVAMALFMTGAFSYKPVAIMSNSMLPVFSRGSAVIVQKINDPLDIQIGDIIQYEADNKMITHRVVMIDKAEGGGEKLVFTTKGDNSPSQDRPVPQERAVGVVRSAVPHIGYPTVWLNEVSRGR